MSATPTSRTFRGQCYVFVETVPHRRRDGQHTLLFRWFTHCAECQAHFTFTTPALASKFSPNRRCQHCKRPGQWVGERTGKR